MFLYFFRIAYDHLQSRPFDMALRTLLKSLYVLRNLNCLIPSKFPVSVSGIKIHPLTISSSHWAILVFYSFMLPNIIFTFFSLKINLYSSSSLPQLRHRIYSSVVNINFNCCYNLLTGVLVSNIISLTYGYTQSL